MARQRLCRISEALLVISCLLAGEASSQTILQQIRRAEAEGHNSVLLRAPLVIYSETGASVEQIAQRYEALLITPEWGKTQTIYSPAQDTIMQWSQYRILERLSARSSLYSKGPTPPATLIPSADTHILLHFIGGAVRVNRNGNPVQPSEAEFRVTMNEEFIPDTWTNCAYLVFVRRDARNPRVGVVVGGWEASLRLGVNGNTLELLDHTIAPSTVFTEALANTALSDFRQFLRGLGANSSRSTTSLFKQKVAKKKATESKKRRKIQLAKRRKQQQRLSVAQHYRQPLSLQALLGTPPATRCYYDYKVTPRNVERTPDGRPVMKIKIGSSFDIRPKETDPKIWNAFMGCAGCTAQNAIGMWNFVSQKPDGSTVQGPVHFQVDQDTRTPDIVVELVEDGVISADSCADINITTSPMVMRIPKSTYSEMDEASLPLLAAHEMGHSLGLANEPKYYTPPSVMMGAAVRDGKPCGGMLPYNVSWLDKQTASAVRSDGERLRLCGLKVKNTVGAGTGGDGSGGSNPDPNPTPGGPGCNTNWTYQLNVPTDDRPAWVEEYDGCGQLYSVCSCSHHGGGEYHCGFCGIFHAPLAD